MPAVYRRVTARSVYCSSVPNIYFELTEAFNAERPTVLLASGQAVVFYRIAMMSKDGDWVIRETPDACERVLAELTRRGARYRPGAPLDVRWLAGGWSSHFEFFDEHRRRIRCDFLSRPPRVSQTAVEASFADAQTFPRLAVIDPDGLVLMKQTQRAKDYAVIAEVARLLPPERELEVTTDPDRILALATQIRNDSSRPAVRAARTGTRRDVVIALAEETDELQALDRRRVEAYERAALRYLEEVRRLSLQECSLPDAHIRLCEIAERHLPLRVQD